jgi:hypothetical protein
MSLNHAQPPGFRVLARAGRDLFPLQLPALVHVGAGAVEARLFVVPEDEPYRAFGLHIGGAEDPGEFHDDRRARRVVIGRFGVSEAVHVPGDDVHLVRARRADLRAEDLLARSGGRGLHVERPHLLVGLPVRIVVDAGRPAEALRRDAASSAAPLGGPRGRGAGSWRARRRRARLRGVLVRDPFGVRAAIALELRLDPVSGRAVAIGALPPIAELRQTLDGGLEPLEIEAADQCADRVVGRLLSRQLCRGENDRCRDYHRQRADPSIHHDGLSFVGSVSQRAHGG